MKDRVRVFTIGRNVVPFRFNPLVPPEGVQISQWAKEFAEVFDHSYWLLGGGRHIVLQSLDDLYTFKAPNYPKIQDMRHWVEQKTNSANSSMRERNWIATATRPLQSLCFRETGDIFDTEKGVNPAQFFDTPGTVTILEIDALSNDDKTFFIEIMLQWIRDWMLVSNKRERLNGVIILEEAHHVLNREKTRKLGIEAVTDLIFREIRELGIGMIYVDQHPSMISYPALGNTSTHVYMNLGLDTKYSSDIEDASSMLGLTDRDKDYLRRLPTGHAFMLIRKSEFPNPFLVSFPLAIAERGKIDDATLRAEMEKHVLAMIEERKTMVQQAVAVRVKEKGRESKEKENVKKAKTLEERQLEEKMRKVTGNGWKLLDVLAEAEGAYTSQVARSMKMSNKVFKSEVERLERLGLVGSRQAKVYKQKAMYFFLTHEAELIVALKTGKLPKDAQVIGDFGKKAVDWLWKRKYDVVEESGGSASVKKEGSEFDVRFVSTGGRSALFDSIKESMENMESELHYICASEKIKNGLLQQAAKFSFTHPSDNFAIFATSLDEIDKGDAGSKGGDFQRVEFGP
jgi:DNA-binding HxlR family transcriptional regulator